MALEEAVVGVVNVGQGCALECSSQMKWLTCALTPVGKASSNAEVVQGGPSHDAKVALACNCDGTAHSQRAGRQQKASAASGRVHKQRT